MKTYDIKPARGSYGRLDQPWNVTRNGRHYCRATSRDHAEAIAHRLNEREANKAAERNAINGDRPDEDNAPSDFDLYWLPPKGGDTEAE